MQNIDFGVRRRIADDLLDEHLPHGGVGIAKLRIQRRILKKFPLALYLRKIRADRFGNIAPLLPTRRRYAKAFARPAVPYPVQNQPAFFDFGDDSLVDGLRARPIELFGR